MCQCHVERHPFLFFFSSYNPSIVFVAFSHLKVHVLYQVNVFTFSYHMHFFVDIHFTSL